MATDGTDELLCILVTDLVGWTALGDQRGDDVANPLRQAHFADVRDALHRHQGREIKTMGDSVLATFRSAIQAMRCAAVIQADAESTELEVRIGVHAGEPIADEDDVFGTVVNVASRLCAAGGAGEVILSDVVRALVGRRGDFTFEDIGPLALKGLQHPIVAARLVLPGKPSAPTPMATRAPARVSTSMRPERTMLCPVLVGRSSERDSLRSALDAAADGHGGLVVIAGQAGVGKSRLTRATRERATDAGMTVLSGRCVPGDSPVPYRPLTEAFASHFRTPSAPNDPTLAGFGGHLGKLVPQWRGDAAGGADESPVLLGEAVVRLANLTDSTATLLILEDLHWADAETLAVVEYLADALADESLLCLCTTRPEDRVMESLARLRRNERATILGLDGLPTDDVHHIVAGCLDTDHVPAEVNAWIDRNSDGIPFLVEELLAGLVANGALVRGSDGWTTSGTLGTTVPYDVGESIRQRLAQLEPSARQVIRAAAMLGRRFDWDLLPAVAGVDGRAAVDALRAAVDAQIIEVDGEQFLFRHAITREAVLSDLLPPERRDLASRAWPALERANPGLPGPVCEQAADLAEAAGEPAKAAARLVESARRGLASGAYTTAEATAERARRLAPREDPVALDADVIAVQVLAAAGKPTAALALGRPLLSKVHDQAPNTETELSLVLARASLASGDTTGARELVEAARVGIGDDRAAAARIDAVAAYVALDEARVGDAESLARSAIDGATSTEQPAVACEALEVLGRVADVTAAGASTQWYQRAAELAAEHGLAGWELRARHELALHSWGDGNAQALVDTRDLAARTGALITQAVMDLSLADVALAGFDREACLTAATACVEASRRYGLATEPVAHLWLAGAHALAGDDVAMDASLADALARDPDDPRILGDMHGRVHATRAFVSDDLGSLRAHLDTMMRYVEQAPPTTSIFPGRILWATLHASEDDDLGEAAVAASQHWAETIFVASMRIALLVVEAVARGRRGEGARATELVEEARTTRNAYRIGGGIRHSQEVLASIAAIRDGWGEPARWLRESEAFFSARGHERTARRCRILIGEAGAPVPRRRAKATTVPPSLRALGVTSRELDVLQLVVEGATTREIADRLFLSPKTVERHLSNLFDRTGVRNRTDLAEIGRQHGLTTGDHPAP
ncbi:MAG: helix-turn-helix transcriptional regulator [Acidimicrobiales bacterium]